MSFRRSGNSLFGDFMRFWLIVLIVLYLVLAFIGCLDRQMAVRNASGKEIREDNSEIGRGVSACPGGVRVRVVDSRLAASRRLRCKFGIGFSAVH
jgi:hypothetical protein